MHEAKAGVIALAVFLALVFATSDSAGFMASGLAQESSVNDTADPVVNMTLGLILSNQTIVIGDTENMTVSVHNAGNTMSSPTQAKIIVYLFNGTDLLQEALYTDNIIDYYPNLSRNYSVNFVPEDTGIYFVKSNISFDSVEFLVWNAFIVSELPSTTSDADSDPSLPAPTVIIQVPRMDLQYPRDVRVEQGDSAVFAVDVGNSGTAYLHSLKVFISSSNLLEFDVNPKQVKLISPSHDYLQSSNTSFLVSVGVPEDTPPGNYPLDFRIVSDQIDSVGKVTVTVLPGGAFSIDDIEQRMLNYGVIISDVEHRMLAAGRRGIEVSQPNGSLNGAISGLEAVRILFGQGKYGEARDGLDTVKRNLERATLQLATAEFFAPEPVSIPWAYVGTAALIASGVGLFQYMKWKSRRRPRLIRDTPQEKREE